MSRRIAGACDCHAHVFGPYARFPLAVERSYTPPEAPLEDYLAMLDANGLDRAVLVHASAYGIDHTATLDAIGRSNGRIRGVGVAAADVSDATLEALAAGGIRALRFTEAGGAGAPNKFAGSVGLEAFDALAPRMKALGLHAEMWIPCERFAAESTRLLAAGIPIVLDHLGRLDVSRGLADPSFRSILAALRDGGLWIKLCPARNSKQFPDYEDVRSFHDAIVAANADRLVWGSDRPYLRMGAATPDPAHLLALLDRWVGDAGIVAKILSSNPARLYGFS